MEPSTPKGYEEVDYEKHLLVEETSSSTGAVFHFGSQWELSWALLKTQNTCLCHFVPMDFGHPIPGTIQIKDSANILYKLY